MENRKYKTSETQNRFFKNGLYSSIFKEWKRRSSKYQIENINLDRR